MQDLSLILFIHVFPLLTLCLTPLLPTTGNDSSVYDVFLFVCLPRCVCDVCRHHSRCSVYISPTDGSPPISYALSLCWPQVSSISQQGHSGNEGCQVRPRGDFGVFPVLCPHYCITAYRTAGLLPPEGPPISTYRRTSTWPLAAVRPHPGHGALVGSQRGCLCTQPALLFPLLPPSLP